MTVAQMQAEVAQWDWEMKASQARMRARRNNPVNVAKRQAKYERRRRISAVHESGHATVGVVLGERLGGVSIGRASGGQCLWSSTARPPTRLAMKLGGPLAEAITFGIRSDAGWADDINGAAELLREIEPDARCVTKTQSWAKAKQQATDIIRNYYGLVHRLADGLIQHGELDHADVSMAVSIAQQEHRI